MPTEEDFRLYERMAGGTGDIEQDAHIARHLQRIVDIPEREISSFVRTRDRDTVHKLRSVLKALPRGQSMKIGGPRAGMRPPPKGQSATDSEETKGRLKDMASSTRTSYHHHFGGNSVVTTSHAFDGIIKNSFQPHFEKWREQADEAQVRVLADACRSLRQFVTSKGPPTCYKDMFPKYNDADFHPPPVRNNKKNLSVVPLGCIYNPTSGELEALATRQQAQRCVMDKAYLREEEIFSGTAFRPEKKHSMKLCTFSQPPKGTTAKCLSVDFASANGWKSENRTAHNNDVHSTRQTIKFGQPIVTVGASLWAPGACAADTRKRLTSGGQRKCQSTPSLSRTM